MTLNFSAEAGEVFFVDANYGNDSNYGRSGTAAFKTINKANLILKPGDIVYIKSGIYQETIRPTRSGTEGNYITYAGYNNDKVTITDVKEAVNVSDRNYIVIDGITMLNTIGSWVYMNNSKHNVIKNCHMEESGTWCGICMTNGADYNKILNNTLIGRYAPDDLIMAKGAMYNLFEGNDFSYGPHVSLEFQGDVTNRWNIVRDNTFRNPYHTSLNMWKNSDNTLVENNIILDSGEDHQNIPLPPGGGKDYRQRDRNMARRDHGGIQIGSSNCIVRNNVFINNGSFGYHGYGDSLPYNNRIYNNTFNKNYRGVYTNTSYPVHGNVIKNNIFFKNREYEISRHSGTPNGDRYINNNVKGAPLLFEDVVYSSVFELDSKYKDFWQNNYEKDPQFVDGNNRNLHLKPTSPMIDAGASLTRTVDRGNGRNVEVEDASYFTDGWGVIEGDLIQLEGQTKRVRIVKIDYKNRVITVDCTLSWRKGQGVSLPYKGVAPDVGAYEY